MTADFESRDGIAIVTLDNPPVNGLGYELRRAFAAQIEAAGMDAAIRAIVVIGAGRAFSGGADIREFGSPKAIAEPNLLSLIRQLEACPKPVVAAVHGTVMGGGLELALGCHARIVIDDPKLKLGQPEVKLGLIPGGGGTQRLPRLVGIGRANLLNLSGDFIDAGTAYEWGLVERVVPGDELLGAATAIAAAFAARSPHAVAVIRELARTTRDLSLEEGLRREADAFRRCLMSEDGREGVAAFVEKREPEFAGR
jgi:3-hydroxyacyl-CoA dehydrogenase